MLKAIKKIFISILVLYICISPLSQISKDVSNVKASSETSTETNIGITRERIYSFEESQTTGFQYYIHVGNVTYTSFYQNRGFYKDDYIAIWDSTIKKSGCGITSCSNLLSGYGVNLTPRQILQEAGSQIELTSIMSRHGVNGQWYQNRTQQEYVSLIEEALSQGKPVMVFVKPLATTFWTSHQHYMVVVGQDSDYLWLCDPSHSDDAHQMYTGKVQGLAQDLVSVFIPSNPPEGGNAGATFEPSQITQNGNGNGNGNSNGNGNGNGNGSTPNVSWEINDEIPDLDELGDFKYKGNPKGMTYNGEVKPLEWVFNLIKNFIDYILGMIFTVIKIAIVGTIENIENLINGVILQIEQIDEDIHYTIEDIVYNRVPVLDPNILSGTAGGMEIESGSTLEKIKNLIAGWYVGFRNISIFVVFIMLIYTGIKMAITTSAEAKSDSKQQLFTWVKCMAMLFLLHYVIFLVLNLNNTLVSLFDPSRNTAHENILYNTIKTRAYDLRLSIGFTGTVMYIVLFIYWIKFLLIYIKRLLKIVLLVVTSPFVIARYALDNANRKGKKAYKDWLHDFTTNVLIQSVHALEYTVLVGIAVDLGSSSIIGFIIALVFLSQILKFDEVILSILKFEGEDTGARIQPLKTPLNLRTYLNYNYAKTAIGVTGKAARKVGKGVSKAGRFANNKLKDATDIDILGTKDAILNKKDDLLKNTIGRLSSQRSAIYDLRKIAREKDEKGKGTERAKQAKKTITTYKKEKKKRYKALREGFVKQSRLLSTAVGIGKFTIGTAVMTQNLTAGALMVGLSPKEIKEAIIEHDKRKEKYDKNNKKINELGDTIKSVSEANNLEDGIQEELERMGTAQRQRAIRELMSLSSLNGNTELIDDSINSYMRKHNIKIINNDNIDTILNSAFETIDPNKQLTATQREQFIRELKKNLQIKRSNEWMNMEQAAKDAEEKGLDEKGKSSKKQQRSSKETKADNSKGKDKNRTENQEGTKPSEEAKEGRTIDDWAKEKELSKDERIEKARETYMSHYTRGEVANMFSQSIQEGIVSKENMEVATKVNQIQDINYKYMKRNKKKLKDTNKFVKDMGEKFK